MSVDVLPLGLTTPPTLPGNGGGTILRPGEFTDGAMVDVAGHFQIPANRTTATLRIPYSLATQSMVYYAPVQWALDQVGILSTRLATAGGAKPVGSVLNTYVVLKNDQWYGTGTGYRFLPLYTQAPSRIWKNLGIGAKQVWWEKLVNGEKPLAKFTHPTFNKTYGVFLTIDGGYFTFTFKEAQKAWYETVWDWLVNLASKIISFVSDLFDALMGIACTVAKARLNEISAEIGKGTHVLSQEKRSRFMNYGLSFALISKIETGVTGAVAKQIGQAVIDTACPKPATTPITTEKTGSGALKIAVIVGGVAAAGGIVYWLATR